MVLNLKREIIFTKKYSHFTIFTHLLTHFDCIFVFHDLVQISFFVQKRLKINRVLKEGTLFEQSYSQLSLFYNCLEKRKLSFPMDFLSLRRVWTYNWLRSIRVNFNGGHVSSEERNRGRMLKILLAFPFNLDYSHVSSLSAEILIIQEMQIKFEGTYSSIDENFEFS